MNIRVLAKVLILATGTNIDYQREASTEFLTFLHRNILLLECSEKEQTCISVAH